MQAWIYSTLTWKIEAQSAKGIQDLSEILRLAWCPLPMSWLQVFHLGSLSASMQSISSGQIPGFIIVFQFKVFRIAFCSLFVF